jgi:site-specific DNA recombinase
VLEAVKRVLDGASVLSVARDFNFRSIPSPEALIRERKDREQRESKWHARTLTLILRSPSLRNVVTHKGRILRDDTGLALRYGPPLVEDDEHRRLVAELERRSAPRDRPRGDAAPLLGVLFCGSCEQRLYRNAATASASAGTKSTVYRCASRYRGLADCDGCSVGEGAAMEFVEREFLALVGRLPMRVVTEDPGEDHSAEIEELSEALDELERDRYEGGLYRGEEGRQRYRDRYSRLEGRLEALRALPSRPPGVRYEETGLTFAQEWELADPAARRKMLTDRGARVLVKGRSSDGNADERLKFVCRGFTDEDLAEQGHDDWTLLDND